MLLDRYEPEDVFARVPQAASRLDPVLKAQGGLLEDDRIYRASCEQALANGIALRWCMGGTRPRSKSCCAC